MSRRNFGGTCCRFRSPSPSPSLVSSGSSQFPLPHPSLRPPSQSIPCLGPSTPRGSKYVSPNSSSYNTHILTAPSSLPPSQSHFPVCVHQPGPRPNRRWTASDTSPCLPTPAPSFLFPATLLQSPMPRLSLCAPCPTPNHFPFQP